MKARPIRVAMMLALAHKMIELLEAGDVPDQAELARRLGFSRARITQLLDLTLLAPDIQETLLFWTTNRGRDPICERDLRAVVGCRSWCDQRLVFQTLLEIRSIASPAP